MDGDNIGKAHGGTGVFPRRNLSTSASSACVAGRLTVPTDGNSSMKVHAASVYALSPAEILLF